MLFFQACSQHDLVICLPEIQLVFAIRLTIKQSIPLVLWESSAELFDHIFTHFITVLADGWTDCAVDLRRVRAEFFLHSSNCDLPDLCHRSSPSGMRKSDRAVHRIDKVQRHTIRVKCRKDQPRYIGDHPIHVCVRSWFRDAVSAVFFCDKAHICRMCLVRSHDIFHFETDCICQSAIIFSYRLVFVTSCKT